MKNLISALFIFFCSPMCFGQNRQISIKIIDSATNEPLQSVVIKVINTGYIGITGKDGKCHFDQMAIRGDTSCFSIEAFYATRHFCILTNTDYFAEFTFPIPYKDYSRKGVH